MADSLNDAQKSHRSASDIKKLESQISTGVKGHQAQAEAFKSAGRSTPAGKNSGPTNQANPVKKDNTSDTKSEKDQKAGYVAKAKSGANIASPRYSK